ncbi:hypothetical protein EQG64_20005 [Streptomyces sp. S6]|nr:hypothetical protein EQG64_20005 [Streptomyces sp. S6]
MTRTNGPSRRLLVTWWVLGPLIVIWAAWTLFSTARGTREDLGGLETSGRTFLESLGSGEGGETCALMTRTAQSELAATQGEGTCPQAVEALVAPLSEAERRELAGSYASRFFTRDGAIGHIGVNSNPLQISELLLSEIDGRWLVNDWH